MKAALKRIQTDTVAAWITAAIAGLLVASLIAVGLGMAGWSPSGSRSATGAPPAHWAFDLGGQTAPDFTLLDQYGRSRTLSSFRGREVVLAFVDAQCTAVCPLTAEILRTARLRLALTDRRRVALIAVNANPLATKVQTVYRWSAQHHMSRQWSFLTGTPSRLRRVYAQYKIYDHVTRDKQVIHDAAVIVIDAHGRERLYFNTADTKQRPTVLSEESAYADGMAQVLHLG
jgi:cytochrome oxidase Cu insertion factor (SCO1/SenC/PrrC family)